MTDRPIEASPEDLADQASDDGADAPVLPAAHAGADLPWDADPADVADQLAEVPLDDDRY